MLIHIILIKKLQEKAPQLYLVQKFKKILEALKSHENLLNRDQFPNACIM